MTMVFAMVETVEALENVEEIAATPGLDGLFVGPSDLSITLSRGAGIDKLGQGDARRPWARWQPPPERTAWWPAPSAAVPR